MKANEIRAQMKRKGKTLEDVAKAIGMSRNSMSRKLLGKSQFTIPEARSIVKYLEIENPADIFLG